jgi:hypothetical protein
MDANDPLVQVIRESFGKVVYSHKTHEKAREIASRKTVRVKWFNIILTSLTSGSFLSNVIVNKTWLTVVSSALAALTIAYMVYQINFNPERDAERHRQTANELWYIRERYIALLADLRDGMSASAAAARRDELNEDLKLIYKFAPDTDPKAYRQAQAALKLSEELTFSNEEINHFLPESLHIGP